jgi:tetratricopeptide (TPR) repeat protein
MAGRSDAGYALCEEIAAKDPSTRPWLAMSVLRMPEIPDRRVDVAITWLEAARADAGAKASPQVLSELGNAWAMKGDYAKATDCLQQAIASAKAMGPQAADYVAAMGEELKAIETKAAGEAAKK